MRQLLTTNWHTVRVLRTGLGLALLGTGIFAAEAAAGIIGGVLLLQGLLNAGCGSCATGACRVPDTSGKQKTDTHG